MSRVLALWTRAFLDEQLPAWRDDGGLARFALDEPEALRGDAITIPHGDMIIVWTSIELGDPIYGLRFAERQAERAIGLLAYAGAHAETAGDAMRTLVRLQRLLDTDNEITLDITGARARLAHRPPPRFGIWPAHTAESCLAAAVHLLRSYTGRTVPLHEVTFQHPDRGAADQVAAWFGCPVRYDQPLNAIVFERAALALPLRRADRTVFTAIIGRAARQLASLADDDDGLVHRARRIVRERLGDSLSISALAQALHVSTRTLQRRLGEHRTTFRTLVDEARLELLQTSADRTGEAATKVGYFDPSSLRRLRRRTR